MDIKINEDLSNLTKFKASMRELKIQWEYKRLSERDYNFNEQILNSLGKNGWELCGIVGFDFEKEDDWITAIFKRPVTEKPPEED